MYETRLTRRRLAAASDGQPLAGRLLDDTAARRGLLAYAGAVAAFCLVSLGSITASLDSAVGQEGAESLALLLAIALVGLATLNAALATVVLGALLTVLLRISGRQAAWSTVASAVARALWPISAAVAAAAVLVVVRGSDWVLGSEAVAGLMALALCGHVALLARQSFAWTGSRLSATAVPAAYAGTLAALVLVSTGVGAGAA